MPELAEVEYFRKRWDPGVGKKIIAVQLHGEKRVFRDTNVKAIASRLVGQKILGSKAHGKQMRFELSGNNWLGIHLGMSGNLRIEAAGFPAGKHDHFVLQQKQSALVFSDARQFGRIRFHHGKTAPDWWEANGPELHSPDFSKTFMREFISRHARAPIKSVLLLQHGFPGIGNWLADEILWRARIAPRTRAGKLTADQLDVIWRTTRFVAQTALKTVGRNFSDPPKTWLLHQRWKLGGRCPRDNTVLRRTTIGGRTTAWCTLCQR